MGQRPDEIRRYEHFGEGTPHPEAPAPRPMDPTVVPVSEAVQWDTSPETDDADEQTSELRADIEQTRDEMSQTIDAIQARLNPHDVKEQAVDAARDVADQVTEQVKETVLETTEALQERLTSPEFREQAKETAHEITEQILHQVKGALHEATEGASKAVHNATIGRVDAAVEGANVKVKGVSSDMMETIRANPFPAALAAIGLGLLWRKRSVNPTIPQGQYGVYGQTPAYAPPYAPAGGPSPAYPPYAYQGGPAVYRGQGSTSGSDVTGKIGDKVGQTASGAADMATGAASNVSDKAGQVVSGAGSLASDVADTAGDVMHKTGEVAGDLASGATHKARDTTSVVMDVIAANPLPAALAGLSLGWMYMHRDAASNWEPATSPPRPIGDRAFETVYGTRNKLERTLRDKPLAVGAVTLGLGAALGLALPETQRESALLGDVADNVMDKVQTVAAQTGDKVQHVVEEVQTTAQKEAKYQGLAE